MLKMEKNNGSTDSVTVLLSPAASWTFSQPTSRLHAFDKRGHHLAGQHRVFALILELRPLRGSRVTLTPPPNDMLYPWSRSSRPMSAP